MRIRRKLLHFLHERVFRHDSGDEFNKFVNFVAAVLMPVHYIVTHNTTLRYDAFSDIYIIEGMKFTGKFLRYSHRQKQGEQFVGTNFDHFNLRPQRGSGKWRTKLYKDFFNIKKKEETMKSNIGIARVCHEANRQYCIDNKLTTQTLWDELPVTQQNSIISGVAEVINNPKVTPAEMHQKWADYKTERGWIYGEVKNVKVQTHPNLVSYKKLPKEERRKNVLFIMTVRREMKK